jgi:hypothetical protein
VPSSTSSFDQLGSHRCQPHWLAEWLLAIGFLGVLILVAEITLRAHGFMPSAPDDQQLWAFARSQVYGHQPRDVIVLVGASRIRLGIDTDVLRRELPGVRIVQLALNGTSPYGVFRDLATDQRFNGVVIYDLMERYERPQLANKAQPWVDYYRKHRSPNSRIAMLLRNLYLGRLVVLSPQFDPKNIVRDLIRRGSFPKPYFIQYRQDRSGIARPELMKETYDLQHQADNYETGLQEALAETPPDEWLRFHEDIERLATILRARGGETVFVRMPSSGRLWRLDEKYFPKARFWDRVAATTSGRAIHFAFLPDVGTWMLYDESHLDSTQAVKFTRTLAQKLREFGVMPAKRASLALSTEIR